jgi:hypothetical protein
MVRWHWGWPFLLAKPSSQWMLFSALLSLSLLPAPHRPATVAV